MTALSRLLFKVLAFNCVKYSLVIFFVLFQYAYASYRPSIQRNYDTQHIKLEIKLNQLQKSISGTATISILPLQDSLSYLEFHAKDIEIRDVTFANKTALAFTSDSEKVAIVLPKSYSKQDTVGIIIRYFAIPREGLFFNEPTATKPNAPYQIYSHSEPIFARCWFPCYDEPDDKLTSEIIATVPQNYYLLSNGKLASIYHDRTGHMKTFHWVQNKPHTTYLISIVAGEYSQILDKSGTIPVSYYVYSDQVEIAHNTFEKTPKMIKFFEELFSYPYPWDKYSQIIIANYQAAGMEHTSATSLYDQTIHDNRAHLDVTSDDLVSHELVHQWCGNLVTCKDWSHIWLNEAFATYAEILFKEFDLGKAEAEYALYLDQKLYLEMVDPKFHQPIVFKDYIHPEEMFSVIEYQKAGLVLHMLRNVLGDSLFFTSLKTYINRFAFQSIETSDFQKIIEEVAGQQLNWFFDQWLYQGGHPKLVITSKWIPDKEKVDMYVRQTQHDSLELVPHVFKLPVEVEINTESENINQTIFIETRQDTFTFSCRTRPINIRFDKNNFILKEINFIKSQDEWLYQLQHDKNVAARLEALDELEHATFDTMETILALEKCIIEDPFWAVRKEASYALIDFQRPESKKILIRACHDPSSHVRAAAILTLSYYYDQKLNTLFRRMAEQDSSYKVVSEALYALSNVIDDSTFDFLSKFVDIDSHNDMVRTAAFHSLRHIRDERSIPIAIRFANDSRQPAYIRANALSILKDVGTGHKEVESTMIELIHESNSFLKKKAIDILGLFKTETTLQALKKLEDSSLPDDVRRRLRISIEKIERGLGNH